MVLARDLELDQDGGFNDVSHVDPELEKPLIFMWATPC